MIFVEAAPHVSCSPSIFSIAQRIIDGHQKSLAIKRLAEESADALRPLLIRNLVAAGDQQDRQRGPRLLHPVSKLKAIHVGHPDIRYEQIEI
jgi:hypothetical protein